MQQDVIVLSQYVIIIYDIFKDGFHGNGIYQMKEKIICTSWYMVAMNFYCGLDFFLIFLISVVQVS